MRAGYSVLLTVNRTDGIFCSYCSLIGATVSAKKIDLLQGTLDLIVLRLLRSGPANGWQLTQSIQVVSKGALEVNYGSIYPALRRLETQGWVKGYWATTDNNRRARFYELTAAGRRQLAAERDRWERFSSAIGLILEAD